MILSQVSVFDVINCAVWGKQMIGCVSDHKDHSDCCRRQDIPESCKVFSVKPISVFKACVYFVSFRTVGETVNSCFLNFMNCIKINMLF